MNEIEKYITTLKKKNTQAYYKICLTKYFKAINQTPEGYFKNKKQRTKKYENDIKKFITSIDKYAPNTQKNYVSIIKTFFLDNDIEFKHSFWKLKVYNKIDNGGTLTLDRAPTNQELKRILSYGNLKARALFTLSATTGMRIGELLQVTLNDVDLEHDPGMITLQSTYVKGPRRPRWIFMSDEAKELLKAWLELREWTINGETIKESERDRSLRIGYAKIKSCKPSKNKDDPRLFPFGSSLAKHLWYDLIHKAGTDKRSSETKRYELHVHSLRKFFMSQMKLSTPEVIVEALAGHKKYLDEAYSRYDKKQIAEFYKKGMHQISIFESQPDLTGITRSLEEKDAEIQKMKAELLEMRLRILELEK